MGKSIITLITDFGTADIYAGVLKGVILSINPECTVVDITHEIPPQDVAAACFALDAAYSYFPRGTIHLVIVDPGVGSARRPILVEAENYCFIGPDNGVFSAILTSPELLAVYHLTNAAYFLKNTSSTFHGRDIFAPIAAHRANGTEPARFGPAIADYVVLNRPAPSIPAPGHALGQIVHIDRFGNLITNFSKKIIEEAMSGCLFRVECSGKTIDNIVPAYAYAQIGELCCLLGSSSFLEIAVANGSAADLLKAKRGDPVKLLKK